MHRILEWVASISMGIFSGGLPNPGIEPASPVSPASPVDSLPTEPSGNISGCHLLVAAALLRSVATCCVCAGSLAA